MKVLIVEDESMAAKRLVTLLEKIDPDIEILAKLDSIKRAVAWLNENKADLLFFDIQLADGLSFQILEQAQVTAPIIFTTAFDEYAIQAFKLNSVDYLLKPIDPEELENAINKYKDLYKANDASPLNMTLIEQAVQMMTKKFKERFVVKIGEHIRTIAVSETTHFFSQEKATFIQTKEQKRFIIDYTLEQVEQLVDPANFFRINRKYLVSLASVKDIVTYSNSRLRLILHGSDEMDAIVSRDKVQEFKRWLDN